jgi:hypothetical protein
VLLLTDRLVESFHLDLLRGALLTAIRRTASTVMGDARSSRLAVNLRECNNAWGLNAKGKSIDQGKSLIKVGQMYKANSLSSIHGNITISLNTSQRLSSASRFSPAPESPISSAVNNAAMLSLLSPQLIA